EEGDARADPPDHQRGLPRDGHLQRNRDRGRSRTRRHAAAGARTRPGGLRHLSHAGRERGAGRRPLREVPRPRPAAPEGRAPGGVRRGRRGARPGARRAARDPARVFALLGRVQYPGAVRLSDRLQHDPDAAGQTGGLRGPDAPRPRRLALMRRWGALGAGACVLGLGGAVPTLGIGTSLGREDAETDVAYQDALVRALELGINTVDTAVNYRHQRSERAIRTALAAAFGRGLARRDEVVVATKGGYIPFEGAVPRDPRAWFTQTYLDTGI